MDTAEHGPHRTLATIVALVAVLIWAYSSYNILSSPPEQRVQFVPDDAYYYLTLARNFVHQSQWSFDSGISLTTGFHPLHAYALAAVYSLTHASEEEFVSYNIVLSMMVLLPAILAAVSFANCTGRIQLSLWLLLFLLSRNFILNTVSGTEWSWVVTFSALYCLAFWHLSRDHTRGALIVLLSAGFLGSLARTDFGLLPAALALASVIAFRTSADRSRLWAAFAGLTASFLGVIVCFGHNYIATGHYLQSSARMKSLWLATYGPSVRPIMETTLTLFGDSSPLTLLLVTIMVLITIICGFRRFRELSFSESTVNGSATNSDVSSIGATLWYGSLFTIIGYIVFYSLNPAGIQHWYTACLVVPVFLLVNLPFLNGASTDRVRVATLLVLLVLVTRQGTAVLTFLKNPEWPHQVSMFRAGHYLSHHCFDGRIGSWNAGIIGYYEGGRVINLDGLVNNDIYRYAKINQLEEYVDKVQIEYVVDFLAMFSSDERRRRGGYDSPEFLRRLVPLRSFDDRSEGWRELTLFQVRHEDSTPPDSR